jgi:hypothetical protein
VPAGGLLGVDQVAVDDDLENAAARRDQGQIGYGVLELFQDLGRQTDGSVEVASDRAVLDRDLHVATSAGRPACSTRTRLC